MGSVRTDGSEETWNSGTGTVFQTGSSTYRGDIALIRIASGSSSGPVMFTGGAGTSDHATVKQMWATSPQVGDQYCTGGAYGGAICGWTVGAVGGNFYYTGTGETARHITQGYKTGACIRPGDSGGPVYTVRSDGGIAAKGIISGVNGYGGSDFWAGSLEPACQNVFTDIWDAYYGLPGVLNTA